jgi:signal transducing adaptor molecule
MNETYLSLRSQGVQFPSPQKPKKETQSELDKQKEEEEFQLALALSLSESESRPQYQVGVIGQTIMSIPKPFKVNDNYV